MLKGNYMSEKILSTDIKSAFKICKPDKKNDPHYEVNICMDENDADYLKNTIKFSVDEWNDLPTILLLCLSYCAKGAHSGALGGKFSDKSWNGSNYGHHVTKSKFEWLTTLFSNFDLMLWNEYGECHSYESITIYYFDENNIRYDVEIPDFDTIFKDYTKDEMQAEMNRLYNEYENT